MTGIKMVITDLDGTLLQADHTISTTDYETLENLGKLGICRVAATGRNLMKVKQVLTPGMPFDFVIFSSGAGLMDWNKQQLLMAMSIPSEETGKIVRFLMEEKLNFKVSREIPDNHHFAWWRSTPCEEFERYLNYHKALGDAVPLKQGDAFPISQVLIFLPQGSEEFEIIKQKVLNHFPHVSVIRATSPLHPDFTWMEIFPEGVTKAHGVEEVCRITGIAKENTLGVGNDFNDMELLDYTQHSYVVDNAPDELKFRYRNSLAHHEDGFSYAVRQHL